MTPTERKEQAETNAAELAVIEEWRAELLGERAQLGCGADCGCGRNEQAGDKLARLTADLEESRAEADKLRAKLSELEANLSVARGERDSWQNKHRQLWLYSDLLKARIAELESGALAMPISSGTAEPLSVGDAIQSISEHDSGLCKTTEEAFTISASHGPEPTNPAESSSELVDPPAKPACLDGIPAVLCEDGAGLLVWAFGYVSGEGEVAALYDEDVGDLSLSMPNASELTPISHDPDAAELRRQIEAAKGGAR